MSEADHLGWFRRRGELETALASIYDLEFLPHCPCIDCVRFDDLIAKCTEPNRTRSKQVHFATTE